jgi:tetratricopeptide (TPR) repeat protein
MRSARGSAIAGGGLLVLIVFVVYWPILRGGFAFDDLVLICGSNLIHASNGLSRIWFSGEAPDYWPVTYSAWWVQWRAFGGNAAGFHVVNVAMHAVDAVLVWIVLRRLNVPGAWAAALLFAVHPANVATVAWISEQKNTFSMFFYALSILFFLKFDERGGWHWYVLALLAFLLGLLSKTSVVMEPVVLLGCVWWRRGRIERRDVWRSVPFFAVSLAAACVTIAQQQPGGMQREAPAGNLLVQIAVACRALWFYLDKTLLPVNLIMIYPNWTVDATRWTTYVPVAGIVACLVVLWRYRDGWGRPVLFGLGYFAVTLFPVLGFFHQVYFMFSRVADQWLYEAMIGVLALVSAGAVIVWRRLNLAGRCIEMGAAVAVFVLLGLSTWNRNPIFASQESLWRDTVARNPEAWMAYSNLGVAYAAEGKLEDAVWDYRRALELKPDYVDAYDNLGNVLAAQGKSDEAIENYWDALRIMPENGDAHEHLGEVLWGQGKAEEAILHWEQALKIEPDSADVLNNLAWALATTDRNEGGDPGRAVVLARRACDLTDDRDPTYPDTLSVAQAAAGEFGDAVVSAEKALELARAAGDTELVGKIESRLKLFRGGEAFYPATRPK